MATQVHLRSSHAVGGMSVRLALTAPRVSGVALFVLAAQFMTVIMLGASIAPDYDFSTAAISDLGVIAETAWLFNASLIVVGLLNLVAGFVLYRTHGRLWILTTYTFAGLGAVGAGTFPLNTGDVHSVFALAAFVFFNVQAIASGALVGGPMRLISRVAGIVGLVFVLLMLAGDGGNVAAFGAIGHGGTERMIVYPVMLWMLAFGGYLMAERPAPDHRPVE